MSFRGYGSIDEVYRAVRDLSPDVAQTATARPAVAVVLWREHGDGAELYLVRRSPGLSFLGGFWSFPGGSLEERDGAWEGPGGDILEAEIACAVRELREELGVQLPLDPKRYLHGARWVTPDFSPIRFDTIYLVHQYGGQEPDPLCSGGELAQGQWTTATDALRRWQLGEWLIPSPILRVIQAFEGTGQPSAWQSDVLSERLQDEARAEQAAPRVWFPLCGVGLTPLRTPTLPPAMHTTCYFFGTDELVLIDPGSPFDDEQAQLDGVLDELERQGRRLRWVLLTHHHGDHVGGAAHLASSRGVKIAAHRETAERLQGVVPVDRYLEDGEVIELAGQPRRSVRALATPGHAPGHLCFVEEQTGAVAAGDMVAGVGTILIDPSEGDMSQYLGSLRRLRDLGARYLLPAHGPVITDPAETLDQYIAHRMWREQRVLDALREVRRGSAAQLVVLAYRDVPPAVHPFAQRSLLAHLHKLAEEGRVRRDGDDWLLVDTP